MTKSVLTEEMTKSVLTEEMTKSVLTEEMEGTPDPEAGEIQPEIQPLEDRKGDLPVHPLQEPEITSSKSSNARPSSRSALLAIKVKGLLQNVCKCSSLCSKIFTGGGGKKVEVLRVIGIVLFFVLFGRAWNTTQFTNPYDEAGPIYITTETIKPSAFEPTEENDNSTSTSMLEKLELQEVSIPTMLKHVANIDTLISPYDIPVLFNMPRSGTSTVEEIIGVCLGLTIASGTGASAGRAVHGDQEVFTAPWGSSYAKFDPSKREGIEQMRDMNFVPRRLADVIVTEHLYEVATLFDKTQKARMFTLIRHPVYRDTSLYYASNPLPVQEVKSQDNVEEDSDNASNDQSNSSDSDKENDAINTRMSIERWARTSSQFKDNWMTRHLSNAINGELSQIHLNLAKQILVQKCLVGILELKDESIVRFLQYFRWQLRDIKAHECSDRILHWGWSKATHHPTLEEGSPAYDLLANLNAYDMELYEFSKLLFIHQGEVMNHDSSS